MERRYLGISVSIVFPPFSLHVFQTVTQNNTISADRLVRVYLKENLKACVSSRDYCHAFQTSGAYPTVAWRPFRTIGCLITIWFSITFSARSSAEMYVTSARRSLSLQSGSIMVLTPPTACITELNSPLLSPFSFRSIDWNLIPRSLKKRSALRVSELFFVPNICIFNCLTPH